MNVGDDCTPAGDDRNLDDEFAKNALQSMRDVFWDPGVERRGGAEVVGPIRKALAILHPGESNTVLFNDEADLVAHHVQVVPMIGDDGWLFGNMHGGPVPPTTVGMWWSKLRTVAGVPHLHVHALRHHYASGLIAQGCDVVMVQRAMGHKSPSITLDTYSHLWPSAEDKTREASSSLIAGSLGPAADWLRTEGGVSGA